ncbi:MAG: class IV adenylate cyclase [Solidesulfovibrio sp.]
MSVADEIETKFAVAAFEPIRRALTLAGGRFLSRRFEENVVLDTPGAALRHQDILLRLRRDASGKVTLKLPAKASEGSALKIRRELETEVADLSALEAIFGHLGYRPFLRYEKVRETWRVDAALVCLDELPFGLFLEIEGPGEAIPDVAGRLGLSMDRAMPQTYHELFQAHRKSHGLPPSDSFVFTPEARREILDNLAKT